MSRAATTTTTTICDRCGAKHVHPGTMGDYEAPACWSRVNVRDTGRDLCPACVVSFRAWFDAPGEAIGTPPWISEAIHQERRCIAEFLRREEIAPLIVTSVERGQYTR